MDDGTVAGRKAVMGALTLYLDFINLFLFCSRSRRSPLIGRQMLLVLRPGQKPGRFRLGPACSERMRAFDAPPTAPISRRQPATTLRDLSIARTPGRAPARGGPPGRSPRSRCRCPAGAPASDFSRCGRAAPRRRGGTRKTPRGPSGNRWRSRAIRRPRPCGHRARTGGQLGPVESDLVGSDLVCNDRVGGDGGQIGLTRFGPAGGDGERSARRSAPAGLAGFAVAWIETYAAPPFKYDRGLTDDRPARAPRQEAGWISRSGRRGGR